LKKLILLLFALCCFSCVHVCQVGLSRCNGTSVELCDDMGQWYQVMDCSELLVEDDDWACCLTVEDRHSCLPAQECSVTR